MKQWQSRDLDLSDPSLKPSPGARTLPGTKGQGPAVPGSVLSPSRPWVPGVLHFRGSVPRDKRPPRVRVTRGLPHGPTSGRGAQIPLLGPALQEGGWQVLLMSPRLRHCWVLTAA